MFALLKGTNKNHLQESSRRGLSLKICMSIWRRRLHRFTQIRKINPGFFTWTKRVGTERRREKHFLFCRFPPIMPYPKIIPITNMRKASHPLIVTLSCVNTKKIPPCHCKTKTSRFFLKLKQLNLQSTVTYLLDFCSRTLEQLNVSFPQDFLVLLQCTLGVLLAGEQDKGIACGTSIRVVDKQNAILPSADRTHVFETVFRGEEAENLLVCGGERKSPHPHYDLVLTGQEHRHLVGRSCHSHEDTDTTPQP